MGPIAWRSPPWLQRLCASALMGGQAIATIMRGRIRLDDVVEMMQEAGPESLSIVVLVGMAAGTVFNVQIAAELTERGAASEVGGILAAGLSREVAPILSAMLITGKVATSYAAQLGTMKVTEQIDAITMLRTDPVDYLVVPRLLALLVMTPVQTLAFFAVGIFSGRISCESVFGIPPQVFWDSVYRWMWPSDVRAMLVKGMVFGLLIAVVACGYGLTTEGGPKEVGRSTTGAVVVILVLIALTDVALTSLLFR